MGMNSRYCVRVPLTDGLWGGNYLKKKTLNDYLINLFFLIESFYFGHRSSP
jgi:hypothetical protein